MFYGWTNHKTWQVIAEIDNNESDYNLWHCRAKELSTAELIGKLIDCYPDRMINHTEIAEALQEEV